MAAGVRVCFLALLGLAAATNPEGQAYLDGNAQKENVVVLPSGLQYEIIESGLASGAKPASTSDACTCHYTGKLPDGSIFDSSVQRGSPATFSPGGVIGGWTEALMMMRPGDKWVLSIPSHLGYGDGGSGAKIPGGAALIFELELISHKPASWEDWLTPRIGMMVLFGLYQLYGLFGGGGASPADKAFSENFLAVNKNKKGVVTLASGLQYEVLRAGNGDAHPLPNSPCLCHYEGRCAKDYPSGKKFDSSYDRGSPTSFAPNQVIKGWTEAMQLMVEGDKWEMTIPSNLAYGDSGRVPGCLVFTMEIIKINGGTKPKVKKDD
jgi:FKBP-type peptidyl-prolyl cis-trans isomerase